MSDTDFTEAIEAFGACGLDLSPQELVDRVEYEMVSQFPETENPVTHAFTPGLYCRTMYMAGGTLATSKIHNQEHQYVIVSGSLSVWTKETGAVTIHAPFHGITKPGTRRVVYAHTDVCWLTFHPTNETDLAVIEDQIIMKHTNILLEGSPP